LKGILPPTETFCGLSYGQWAARWCNWLFSDMEQNGPVSFLRGNMDCEPPVVITGAESLSLRRNIAIFFPIICSFITERDFSEEEDLAIERHIRRQQTHTSLLKLSIDEMKISNLRRFFATSHKFVLEMSEDSILRHYSESTPQKCEAVVSGYWIMLMPLSLGTHSIKFEGWDSDGFKTSGRYTLNVSDT
jgi:hypothetical protein